MAGNIGGGGFTLVRLANGQTAFFDFRERAPARQLAIVSGPHAKPTETASSGGVPPAFRDRWRDSRQPTRNSAASRGRDLVAPAISLARDGFTVTAPVAASLGSTSPFEHDPESKRIFLRDGNPYKEGETFKQPDLAGTLERISNGGAKEFYEGETAQRLAADMAAHGGLITLEDLKNYKVIERTPLTGEYKGFHIITSPPPSAGSIGLLQMMGMLTGMGYESGGPDSVKAVHYEAEAMRRFYADRSEYLGDPEFYNVPVKQLLAPAYLSWRRGTIDPNRASPATLFSRVCPNP